MTECEEERVNAFIEGGFSYQLDDFRHSDGTYDREAMLEYLKSLDEQEEQK